MKNEKTILDFAGNEAAMAAYRIIMKTNHSVYLTGHIGTGKTTFVNMIQQAKFKDNKSVAVLVLNNDFVKRVNGQTIDDFFRLNDKRITSLDPEKLDKIKYLWDELVFIRNLDTLIIYCIDRFAGYLLDIVDYQLKKIRKNDLPFGNVQILAVGDHFTCIEESLKKQGDTTTTMMNFFSSTAYQALDKQYVRLEKCYADISPVLLDIIKGLRIRKNRSKYLKLLNQIVEKNKRKDVKRVILTTSHHRAKEINDAQMKEPLLRANTIYSGDLKLKAWKSDIERFHRDTNFFEGKGDHLVYRDTQVVFLEDDPNGGYKRGDIGVVIDRKFMACVVELETFLVKLRFKKADVGYLPYPIRTCWAVNVDQCHDIQLQNVEFELADDRSDGLAHIALTKCRNLDKLTFTKPLTINDVTAPDAVFEYDQLIQESYFI